jgi:hypothetical protein
MHPVKADNGTNYPQIISISTGGTQGNGDSNNPFISSTGRYVVFSSTSGNLLGVDYGSGFLNCYLRD